MKNVFCKIIAFAVCGAILIVSLVAFKIETHAAGTTTVILTGEDLYALLSSGEWEAKVNHGDIGYRILEPSFMAYHADGYFYITYDTSNVTNAQDIYGANILFSPTIEYDSVTSFEIVCGSILIYINQYEGGEGPSYAWDSSSSVNVIHDSGTYLIDTFANLDKYIFVQNYMYTPARMASYSATFDPTINLKSFIANQNFNLNLESNGDPNYYVYSMQTVVDSITVTFENPDDSEVLIKQVEKANKYLEEINESIEDLDNKLTNSTDDDKSKLDDMQSYFDDVKDKADEYNEAMDSVETPEPEEVIPEDSVSQIYEDENVATGKPYIFSILESLQSITWILTMILISVTVGIIKYIIYGKS